MGLSSSDSLTRLTALDAAIDAFVAGGMVQSYTADGITVTKANLKAMMDYRERLRREVSAGKISGVAYADVRGHQG